MRPELWLVAVLICTVTAQTAGAAESWHCTFNDPIAGLQIKKFTVLGNELVEPADDFLTDFDVGLKKGEKTFNPNSYAMKYTILRDDNGSLIAEADFAGPDDNKNYEVSVENVVILKLSRNFYLTSILSHLPAPPKTRTLQGTCNKDQ